MNWRNGWNFCILGTTWMFLCRFELRLSALVDVIQDWIESRTKCHVYASHSLAYGRVSTRIGDITVWPLKVECIKNHMVSDCYTAWSHGRVIRTGWDTVLWHDHVTIEAWKINSIRAQWVTRSCDSCLQKNSINFEKVSNWSLIILGST